MRIRTLIATTACAAIAGCGGGADGADGAKPYTAAPTATALRAAGWRAAPTTGMPKTVSGTRQVAYLETTTPGGHRIDVQFLAGDAQAKQESVAATKRLPGFHGVVIGNALAFIPPGGKVLVEASDRDALAKLIRR